MRANNVFNTAFRASAVFAVLLTLSVAANAYTVVMRGGKRIEIPSQFTLTASTLTYEVSPGVQISIATAAIDVTATEKANNELPGSFLRRVRAKEAKDDLDARSTSPPVRTITNRDLESTAQRRRASELAYENRRKQLGLPTVEESRRQAEAEAAVIREQLAEARATEKESENYWRERASALKTETAALDAELNYVSRRLDETALGNGSVFSVTSGVPFGLFDSFGSYGQFGRGAFGPPARQRPLVFGSPRNASPTKVLPNRRGTRGNIFSGPFGFPRSRSRYSPVLAPNLPIFGSDSGSDTSYERSWLITRFNELSGARAGLQARWRELEDEARRAGAPPGWLRE